MPAARRAVKALYLDASALVMQLVDEGDCADLRAFCNDHPYFNTTGLCVAEALGVLKRKWRKSELTMDEYLRLVSQLTAEAKYRIYETEPDLTNDMVHAGAELLARRYELDVADALQLYTLRHGPFRHLCGDSASVLVTADRQLAAAATSEGLRVWNCRSGPAPDWAQ